MTISKATVVFILLMVVGYFGVFVFFINDSAPPSHLTATDSILCTLEHNMLSAIINAESGPDQRDARDPYLVGSTVLNRSEHQDFPDVVAAVIKSKGQYKAYGSRNYHRTATSDTVALKLIQGLGRDYNVLFFKGVNSAGFEDIKKKYKLITVTNSHTFYGE